MKTIETENGEVRIYESRRYLWLAGLTLGIALSTVGAFAWEDHISTKAYIWGGVLWSAIVFLWWSRSRDTLLLRLNDSGLYHSLAGGRVFFVPWTSMVSIRCLKVGSVRGIPLYGIAFNSLDSTIPERMIPEQLLPCHRKKLQEVLLQEFPTQTSAISFEL